MNVLPMNGQTLGQGLSSFLDPFHLFKSKLRAATRSKFHDSADLRWLGDHFGLQIKPHASKFNSTYVGLAISRYSILERLFVDLGIGVEAAKTTVKDEDLNNLPQPQPGDAHKRILGGCTLRYRLEDNQAFCPFIFGYIRYNSTSSISDGGLKVK